jgi:hypothetical protein
MTWQERNLLPNNSWMLQFLQLHRSGPCALEQTSLCDNWLGGSQQLNRCVLVQCQNKPAN